MTAPAGPQKKAIVAAISARIGVSVERWRRVQGSGLDGQTVEEVGAPTIKCLGPVGSWSGRLPAAPVPALVGGIG